MQTSLDIYSKEETIYFTGLQLAKLKFKDIEANMYRAYNTENINSKNVCPSTFDLIGNACYRLLSNKVYDWNQARDECLSLNSNIAWFTAKQDVDLVRSWLNTFTTQSNDIWTGGKAEHTSWYWSFNRTLIPETVLVPNWAPNKPVADAHKNAILFSSANGYLFTNDAPEKRQYSVLCKRDAFVFDASDTTLDLKSTVNAIDMHGNALVGFKFVTRYITVVFFFDAKDF